MVKTTVLSSEREEAVASLKATSHEIDLIASASSKASPERETAKLYCSFLSAVSFDVGT